MTLRDFVRGELIDIVEWLEDSTDTMVWRFARPDNEIKNGAQLIVRPAQVAVFVDQGEVADVFSPGKYQLTTRNLPLLSRLRGWKYGFQSPFRAEVVFVSTRQFPNRKWGTKSPVITRDAELGPVRLRAFGTYSVRVHDPIELVRQLVGANATFTIDQIADQLRNLVVARFSDLLGEEQIPVLKLAAAYTELADCVAERVRADFAQYGLEITKVVVESITVPSEVEGALDQRTRMGIIGDIASYAQLQAADALREAARNPNGAAASAVGFGLGFATSQQAGAAAPTPAAPSAVARPGSSAHEPPPVPTRLWYYVAEGQRRGPVDAATLSQRVADGTITGDALVWREGMSAWAPASQVDDLRQVLGDAGGRKREAVE